MNFVVEQIEHNLEKNPKLRKDQLTSVVSDLEKFLRKWDDDYAAKVCHIPLFNIQNEFQWSAEHKKFFCKILYHARGRLKDFLWHLGNVAPDKKSKDLVLYNFSEEFGGYSPSHEELYFYFVQDMGSSPREVTDKNFYPDFFKEYNEKHLDWLENNDWCGCVSAFSAYERLDNIDYANLLTLAKKLGTSKKGLIFFKVHAEVEHFSATVELLNEAWSHNEKAVRRSFEFIADHQAKMWNYVSDVTLDYHPEQLKLH